MKRGLSYEYSRRSNALGIIQIGGLLSELRRIYASTCRIWRSFKLRPLSNRNFDCHRSICYRSPKIVKLIIYTLNADENVSRILICVILICEVCYVFISFQSYRISFYIENTRWFCIFTYLHYKQQSHGKEISVPRYTTQILG